MVTGEGLDSVAATLVDRMSVVVGPSGVGKSSIINALRTRSAAARAAGHGVGVPMDPPLDPLPQADPPPDTPGEAATAAGAGASDGGTVSPAAGSAAGSRRRAAAAAGIPDDAGPYAAILSRRKSPLGAAAASRVRSAEPPSAVAAAAGASEPPAEEEALQLQSVGEVSQIGRGKHTTRHVSLLAVDGGLLADTPGFNMPTLDGILPTELAELFPEARRRLEDGRCSPSGADVFFWPRI